MDRQDIRPVESRPVESGVRGVTNQVFVILGGMFLVLLLIGAYLFVADPYGLRPLLLGGSATTQTTSATDAETAVSAASVQASGNTQTDLEADQGAGEEVSGGFTLSGAQIEALASLGIDPASVPESVSAAQEACFVEALGEDRVAEIKAGAVPGGIEFVRAQGCL